MVVITLKSIILKYMEMKQRTSDFMFDDAFAIEIGLKRAIITGSVC